MDEREAGGPSDEELERAIPKDTGGREARVGLFVLVGIVASLAVLFLTTDPGTFRGRYRITATLDDAGGVRAGDPVQMRGVNIGRVRDFAMDDQDVTIILEIEGEWQVPADSRVRIAGTGLIGGRTLEVLPGESEEALPPGGNLTGESSADITSTLSELGGEASTTLERVQALLSEPFVNSMEGSAEELNALLSELSELTREQQDEVARLLATLNRTAEGLESASGAGPDLARAVARADSALARLNRTGATLDDAAGSLRGLLAGLERGEGTLGQLARNDSLYQNLNRAVESLALLLADVRENPGRYVRLELF